MGNQGLAPMVLVPVMVMVMASRPDRWLLAPEKRLTGLATPVSLQDPRRLAPGCM